MTKPPPPATVFILPGGFELGGVTNWVMWVARSLHEEGKRVAIVTHGPHKSPPINSGLPPEIIHNGPDAPLAGNARGSDIRRFAELYSRLLPAVFIPNFCHGGYAACALLRGAHPEKVRVAGWAHTDEWHYYRWLAYYAPVVDHFVGVSQETADRLRQIAGPGRVSTLVYGVDVHPQLNRSWSSSGALRIGYVGRIIQRQKRIWRFLDLARILNAQGVEFTISLVGDGPELERLQRAVSAMGLGERIRFLGRLPPDEVREFWAAQDICALTSDYEGTSIAMLEAMAAGTVPVVPSVSGMASVVSPGRNGAVYHKGRIEEMASRIAALAHNRESLALQGQAAHALVLKRYSKPAHYSTLLDVLDKTWRSPPATWPSWKPLISPLDYWLAFRPLRRMRHKALGVLNRAGLHPSRLRERILGRPSPPLFP